MSYRQLLQKLVDDHRQDSLHLKEMVSTGRDEDAKVLAHKIRGAAGTLGLTKLHTAAAEVETKLNAGDILPTPLIEGFSTTLANLISAIDRLPNTQQHKEEHAEPGEIEAILKRSLVLLENGDTSVNELWSDSIRLLRQQFGSEVDSIQGLIEGFDYPAAQVSLSQILLDFEKSDLDRS